MQREQSHLAVVEVHEATDVALHVRLVASVLKLAAELHHLVGLLEVLRGDLVVLLQRVLRDLELDLEARAQVRPVDARRARAAAELEQVLVEELAVLANLTARHVDRLGHVHAERRERRDGGGGGARLHDRRGREARRGVDQPEADRGCGTVEHLVCRWTVKAGRNRQRRCCICGTDLGFCRILTRENEKRGLYPLTRRQRMRYPLHVPRRTHAMYHN